MIHRYPLLSLSDKERVLSRMPLRQIHLDVLSSTNDTGSILLSSFPPILISLLYFRIISGFPRSADRTIVVHFGFVYHHPQNIMLFIFGLTTGIRESAATSCIDAYVSSVLYKSPEMILPSSFFHSFTTVTTDISLSHLSLRLSANIMTLLFSG